MSDISLEGSTISFETKNRRLNHDGNFVVSPLTAFALAIDTSSISPILRKYGNEPILEISGYPVSHMVDALATDLQALRGKVNALKVQREGLSNRIRNLRLLHSPPLPKKVLLEIFSYLPLTGADVSRQTLRSPSHLQDIQLSLFRASAVCRAWRDALQSDHSIWSYVSFVCSASHRVSEFQLKMQVAMFQQQLQKAQSSTLSVVIASPIHQAPISFWKTCRRWSYLDAVMMTTDMLNAFQHRHRNRVEGTPGPLFPTLTHLRLPFSPGGLEKARAIAMFGESPHLQSLTLNGLRSQDIPRKLLHRLRVLKLDPMNAQEVHLTGDRRGAFPYHTEGVLDFLSHTALLEELYAYDLIVSDRPSKRSSVKLKNLTKLCLTGSYGHLLPYLSAYRSLKHLDIQLSRSYPQEMYDVLMSFLERCTPALTNIRIISDFAFTIRQIIPIVEVIPSLTSLILESSGPPAADIFDCIREEGLLLNLRSLCIVSHSEPTSLETLDAILHLCQSSWGPQNLVKPAVPIRQLTTCIAGEESELVAWPVIQHLRRAGMTIELQQFERGDIHHV